MGQQQLILLVLATVIVGLATVVGIRAFSENSVKSNADAMMQDAVRIANDLQAWKQKPAPFGGQAQSQGQAVANDPTDFSGSNWTELGYEDDGSGNYVNLNGSFTLSGGVITGTNTQQGNIVTVEVCGLSDDNVAGAITQLGGATTGQTVSCTP